MKTLFTLFIISITLSLSAQSAKDKEILKSQFDKSISGTILLLDKVVKPNDKIENAFLIQSAVNFCKETSKCKTVASNADRGIYSDELASLNIPNGIALSAKILVTTRR